MFFARATVAAAAVFLPCLVSAHVAMVFPKTVFTHNDGLDWSPLDPTGSNYPCFTTSGSTGELPVYEPGSMQKIGLEGSAVHGGGSCQVSITYDNPPTANSVFKVIKSWEGGCPLSNTPGNLPANPTHTLPDLEFEVPDIRKGDAVVAWSWFNKIGNREMYMRCAPVKIGGSRTDDATYNALPDIFKANIGNDCSTTEDTDVIFPNPGSNLVGAGNAPPVGNCGTQSPPPVLVKPKPSSTTTPTPTPTPTQSPIETSPVESRVQTSTEATTKPTPEPSPPANGGSCVDGEIICISETRWSLCSNGTPIDMGQTAAGMACVNGGMELAKRSVRFSHEHVRRRHYTSRLLL